MIQYFNFARDIVAEKLLSLEHQSHLPMRMADSFRILKPMADSNYIKFLFGRLLKPSSLKYGGTFFNLNSAVGSDEEPQDLDGERHEDFEGHILGSYVQKV
jgi:hypothetical protein